MKSIAFIDYENIYANIANLGYRIQPEDLVELVKNYSDYIGADLQAVYLYANFDKEEFWKTQSYFQKKGVFTRHIYSKNSLANTELRPNAADLELILDAQEILLTRPSAVDIVILFTCDGDFFPLVKRILAWGKEVRIVGVKDKIHHDLLPFCDNFDIFSYLQTKDSPVYIPSNDLRKGIEVIARMQLRLPYVASTRARLTLSKELERSPSEIKELIRYMLSQKVLIEKEQDDSNLLIKKTKIYLLNLDHPLVQEVLEDKIEQLQYRYQNLSRGENLFD
ncbi:MAG TPA: NYN domain-containing protein [Peptococcaceae bacterium]|nr:NYN domain-containing protein [Peptococcaceae bacterium]